MEWFKDASYKKEQTNQLMKEKDREEHENFINQGVKNYEQALSNYNDNRIKHLKLREYKNQVGYVPVDAREAAK